MMMTSTMVNVSQKMEFRVTRWCWILLWSCPLHSFEGRYCWLTWAPGHESRDSASITISVINVHPSLSLSRQHPPQFSLTLSYLREFICDTSNVYPASFTLSHSHDKFKIIFLIQFLASSSLPLHTPSCCHCRATQRSLAMNSQSQQSRHFARKYSTAHLAGSSSQTDERTRQKHHEKCEKKRFSYV